MAEKIYGKDLYGDDGTLQKLIDQLIEVGKAHTATTKKIQANAVDLQKSLEKVNATTTTQREQIGETAKKADDLSRAYARQQQALADNAQQIEAVKLATRELNAINRLEAKLNAAKEDSYDKLSARYSLMKIAINKLTIEERTNTKAGKEMVAQSKAIYEQMKQLQEATGKHQLSVGDYTKALEGIPGAAGGAVSGLNNLSSSLKALTKNPIVLVLSLIVGGLYALFNAFKSSAKGAETMAKVSAVLSGLWSELIGIVSGLTDNLVSAFEDPQQAMKDFGSFLISQITNRLKATIDIVTSLGEAFAALWRRDMAGLRDAAGQAATAVVQLVTGMDSDQQKKFAESIAETTKEVIATANAFAKLEAARLAVSRSNRALVKQIEDITNEEAKLNAIAGDSTRSFKEMTEANKAALKATEERAALEIKVAKNNLGLINQEIALRRANGENIEVLLDSQIQAYRELAGAERALTEATYRNTQERQQIFQDQKERDLDILIDGFDNQKTINERRALDDRLTFDQRRAILEETERLSQDSFEKQIAIIQEFTKEQVNANDLITESDAAVLNEKIRVLGLSEILEGRLLEIVRDKKTANNDLLEAQRDLNKAESAAAEAAIKAAEDRKKALIEQATTEAEQLAELKQSEFDLQKRTEAEKTVFALNAEKERFEKILEINETLGGELTEVQIQTYRNLIQAIDTEINSLGKDGENKDIFDLFGLNISDEKKQAIKDSIGFAIGQWQKYADERLKITNQLVSQANQEVTSAENALQAELAAVGQGQAARVEAAREELDMAKANQAEALREQKKAQQAQNLIQTAEQGGNLLTMASKVYAQFGFPLGLGFAGLMLGSFATARIKIAQLTKRLGDGDEIDIEGSAHSAGGDTYIGTHGGTAYYAEEKEKLAVFNKRAVMQYGPSLSHWIASINDRTWTPSLELAQSTGGTIAVHQNNISVDTGTMEGYLGKIAANTATQTQTYANGTIEKSYASNTTYYR